MKTRFKLLEKEYQENPDSFTETFMQAMNALKENDYSVIQVSPLAIENLSCASPKSLWKTLFKDAKFAQLNKEGYLAEFFCDGHVYYDEMPHMYVSLLELKLGHCEMKVAFLLNENFDLLLAKYDSEKQCYIAGAGEYLACQYDLRVFQLFYDYLTQLNEAFPQLLSCVLLGEQEECFETYMNMYGNLCSCQGAMHTGFLKF